MEAGEERGARALPALVKRLWGFAKVRYRRIYKNTVRALTKFALANLYLARRRLLPPRASCALRR
jgi:IS5 family transposase